MRQRIYISDLDGTLLNKDALLSEFSRNSILKLLAKGLPFTVATARSFTSTKEILGNIPFELPVICANGGSIYNYQSEELLHVEYINPQTIAKVIEDIKTKNDTAFVSSNVNGEEKVFYDSLPNEGMKWYYQDRFIAKDKRLTKVKDIRECLAYPITTITFMNNPATIARTKSFYESNYNAHLKLNHFENKYSPGWYWLSIHSPKTTKGHAIKKLMDILSSEAYQLTVFGDELNDLQMFELADHSIAVGNAQPEVKKAANEIIGHHNEDAVVRFLNILDNN